MTDESQGSQAAGSKAVPGSGAGDAAPTQAIPRIPKAPAKGAAGSNGSSSTGSQTDKGRPRKTAAKPAAAAPAPAKGDSPAPSSSTPKSTAAATSTPSKPAAAKPAAAKPAAAKTATGKPAAAKTAAPDTKRPIKPAGGPTGRPLTAADYRNTTSGSPAATAVIPAVKDRPSDSKPSAPAATVAAGSGRRASLRLTHVEPWSVTRLAFAISVAMMIVAVVAVTIFWFVLDLVGVWDQINDSFTTVLSDNSASFNVTDYFGLGRVVGLTLVLSAVNVVLATALATIGAHLYNLAAQLMGGVEVTLAEDK